MHELGVIIEVVKTVEIFAKKNGVSKIDTLVLEIGELSAMIPKYIESCYPAAVDGTLLENTKLSINILPGNGYCKSCEKVFSVVPNQGLCPICREKNWDLISGREFRIKEILGC